jgi:hypothetical protein
MGAKIKEETWRHLTPIMPGLLFDAWRVGDTIPDGNLPRGGRNTKIYKHQQRTARLLWQQRCHVHRDQDGSEETLPTLDDCAASRNPLDYYLNILGYLVALRIIFCHKSSRRELSFAQRLLARCASQFARMNVYLNPSFHYI